MKKILIIHHGIGFGGGLIALLGLINELKEKNEVRVLSVFNSEAVDYIKKTGVKVYLPKSQFYSKFYRLFVHSEASYFNFIDYLKNIKNILTFFLSKYLFAKKELMNLNFEYEIVYLNSTFISDWSLAAKELGKKTVIHIREPLAKGFFGVRKNIIRQAIRKYCDNVIAISKDNAARVGLMEKTTIVYDPVVRKGRNERVDLFQNSKFRYFLYLGGMQRIKGFEQLVKSLKYLNDNVKIYFLGGDYVPSKCKLRQLLNLIDPYNWRINSLIDTLNKSDKIIRVGLVDNIFDYYQNSRALISPFSKPHASLPVLEAFSVGKPVIVSDIEGMDEIVNHENGLFFNNNRPISLAEAINKMASLEGEKVEIMSQNAKNKYHVILKQNGDVQMMLDKL